MRRCRMSTTGACAWARPLRCDASRADGGGVGGRSNTFHYIVEGGITYLCLADEKQVRWPWRRLRGGAGARLLRDECLCGAVCAAGEGV